MKDGPRGEWDLEAIKKKKRRKATLDSGREGKLHEMFPVSLGKADRQLEREKGFYCRSNCGKETSSLPVSWSGLVGYSCVHGLFELV